MTAQIALADRAEDRVGERMRRDVGIGMPAESLLVRNLDAAEDQPAACAQRMEIEALADSNCIAITRTSRNSAVHEGCRRLR